MCVNACDCVRCRVTASRPSCIRIGPEFQAVIPPLLDPNGHDEAERGNGPSAAKVWSREHNLRPQLETYLATVKNNQPIFTGDVVYIFDEAKGHWLQSIVVRPPRSPKPLEQLSLFDGTSHREVHFCECFVPMPQEQLLHLFHTTNGKIMQAMQLLRAARKKMLQSAWSVQEVLAFAKLHERFRDNLRRIHIGLQGTGSLRPLSDVINFYHSVFLPSLHAKLIDRPPLAHEYDTQPIPEYILRPPPSAKGQTHSLITTAAPDATAGPLPLTTETSPCAAASGDAVAVASSSGGRVTTRSQASKAVAEATARARATTTGSSGQSISRPSHGSHSTPPAGRPPRAEDSDHDIVSVSGDELNNHEHEGDEPPVSDGTPEEPANVHEEESRPDSVEQPPLHVRATRPKPSLGAFIAEVRTTLPKARSDLLLSNIIACGIGRLSFAHMFANVTAILRPYPHLYEQFQYLSVGKDAEESG